MSLWKQTSLAAEKKNKKKEPAQKLITGGDALYESKQNKVTLYSPYALAI